MSRLAAVAVGAALAGMVLVGTYHTGRAAGERKCEARYQRAAEVQRQEDSDAVERVAAEAKKRQEVLAADRQVVQAVVDPAGCLDVAPPAALAERVRDARARAAGDRP